MKMILDLQYSSALFDALRYLQRDMCNPSSSISISFRNTNRNIYCSTNISSLPKAPMHPSMKSIQSLYNSFFISSYKAMFTNYKYVTINNKIIIRLITIICYTIY